MPATGCEQTPSLSLSLHLPLSHLSNGPKGTGPTQAAALTHVHVVIRMIMVLTVNTAARARYQARQKDCLPVALMRTLQTSPAWPKVDKYESLSDVSISELEQR